MVIVDDLVLPISFPHDMPCVPRALAVNLKIVESGNYLKRLGQLRVIV